MSFPSKGTRTLVVAGQAFHTRVSRAPKDRSGALVVLVTAATGGNVVKIIFGADIAEAIGVPPGWVRTAIAQALEDGWNPVGRHAHPDIVASPPAPVSR
jgi:hypothetical protein